MDKLGQNGLVAVTCEEELFSERFSHGRLHVTLVDPLLMVALSHCDIGRI